MDHPTLAVQAVVPTGGRAVLTAIGLECATIHPTGVLGAPSLHYVTLAELKAWHADLGDKITAEEQRRLDIRRNLDEARAHLQAVR